MDEFILALFAPGDKLKATTLYQLLIGKKTTSVLLFGCLHDLLPFVGLFPKVSQRDFEIQLQKLVQEGHLIDVKEGFYQRGQGIELTKEKQQVLNHLNHFRYGKSEAAAWRMLQFVIQVASNYHRQPTFIPLETAPMFTEPVRLLIRQQQEHLREILKEELTQLLGQLDQEIANKLAQSFSGWQVVGKTSYQLLPPWASDAPWNYLVPLAWHQAFFQEVERETNLVCYQLLAPFFLWDRNQSSLSTQALFEAGFSFEEVCQKRQLKPGTINDHLIEWALRDDKFIFADFIAPASEKLLANKPGDPLTWRFKEVASLEVDFLSFALYQIKTKEERKCF
ncbi:helix-turn-helix domain-containing protein [Enterococcus sp. 2201sp1_2201st1_B8_2201SCRN_220225]|uniref:helix-turn-helix domain-containing protein n=1 Tax=unclassified Enterococcus TaxID=2608891 RepID=UPI0034A4BD41